MRRSPGSEEQCRQLAIRYVLFRRKPVKRSARETIWIKMAKWLRDMRDYLYENSVAFDGPSNEGCCHKPVEELENERERYLRLAERRKSTK